MSGAFSPASVGYVTDATVNNAEALYNGESPNITSLIDLVRIVQTAVLNQWLVTSPFAQQQSSLLALLDFADAFQVDQRVEDGETIFNVQPPEGLAGSGPPLIGFDEHGELCADSAVGELFLASMLGAELQSDDVLGSLFVPENLGDKSRGDAYLHKFAAFMLFIQADRNTGRFDSEESRQYMIERAEKHLGRYRSLTRKLLSARDQFGLDLSCSVLEEPLFGLSVSQEVNHPFEYLEEFDEAVHNAIVQNRSEAFEKWRFPSVGVAVLSHCKTLNDLPKEIEIARDKLFTARESISRMNGDLLSFTAEMKLGDDQHAAELNRLKVSLEEGLKAFGQDTEYQEKMEAFPLSERIWCMPKLLAAAVGVMNAPEQALAAVTKMPWLQRQRYLRYVPGLKDAASYVKRTRDSVMRHLIEDVVKLDWNRTDRQSRTINQALDLIERCCELRSPEDIGNPPITLRDEHGEEVEVTEDFYWGILLKDEKLREVNLLGAG